MFQLNQKSLIKSSLVSLLSHHYSDKSKIWFWTTWPLVGLGKWGESKDSIRRKLYG